MSEHFEGGAQRSEKRLRYDLIPRDGIDGIARRMTIGANKFGDRNWESGGAEFIAETKNHLMHHVLCYLTNQLDDEEKLTNHLDAILWNAQALLFFENRK